MGLCYPEVCEQTLNTSIAATTAARNITMMSNQVDSLGPITVSDAGGIGMILLASLLILFALLGMLL